MATYKLNERAKEDLECLYEHGILLFGLHQANRYYNGLFDRFSNIADNPELWQAVDYIRPGYRRSVYASHSIYYRVKGGTAEIMRILGKQDFSKKLE
jgi:toxin ParE1/3/4